RGWDGKQNRIALVGGLSGRPDGLWLEALPVAGQGLVPGHPGLRLVRATRQFHRGSSPLCPQLFADSNGDGLAGARRSGGFALVDAVRTGDSGRLALAPALLCPQVAFESDRDVLGRRLAARGKKRRALVPLGRACCNEFHSSSSSTVSSCCRPPIMS